MGTSILAVGTGDVIAGDKHLELAMKNVVSPLDADVYAVTDYGEGPIPLCCYSLARAFGTYLKVVGIMDDSEASADFVAKSTGSAVRFEVVPPPGRIWLESGGKYSSGCTAHVQWYRLQEAWRLMEVGERLRGSPYDTVVKLRFDYTPMQEMSPAILAAGSQLNAVHASSDFMFWGRRESMKFTAGTWQAMEDVFFDSGTRPNVMDRPISVGAMLRSYAAQPREAMDQETWKLYNKFLAVPYVDMGCAQTHSPAGVLDNLQAAEEDGVDYVDPQQDGPHPPLTPGLVFHVDDYAPGWFTTEKDFLTWLLANNVTVCDLGAAVNSALFKGEEHERPSVDCSVLPWDDVDQMVEEAKERWRGLMPKNFLDPVVGTGPVVPAGSRLNTTEHAQQQQQQQQRKQQQRQQQQRRSANASTSRLWRRPDRIRNLRGGHTLQLSYAG